MQRRQYVKVTPAIYEITVIFQIFRQVEFLHEIEFGTFVPNWRPQTDLAQIK